MTGKRKIITKKRNKKKKKRREWFYSVLCANLTSLSIDHNNIYISG